MSVHEYEINIFECLLTRGYFIPCGLELVGHWYTTSFWGMEEQVTCFATWSNTWKVKKVISITSGSRGGRTRRAPPLTAADLWFFMPKTLFFLNFSSLASLATNFKHDFNKNMAKNTLKITFTSTFNTFNDFLHFLPPPRWQGPRPPP